MTRGAIGAAAAIGLLLAGCLGAAAQDPGGDALIATMEAAYASVTDYTATFVKRERLEGRLGSEEVIALKFSRPERIYMRWLKGRAAGREVIMVKGRDRDRALIHEPGPRALLTVVIAPDHPRVLQESRHPLTDVGLGRLIALVRDGIRGASTTWTDLPSPDATVRRIEFTSPRPVAACACVRAVVTVDVGSRLAVGADTFDEGNDLLGSYQYRDITLNPGLGDDDFDTRNPDYGFSPFRWSF